MNCPFLLNTKYYLPLRKKAILTAKLEKVNKNLVIYFRNKAFNCNVQV